jgi:ApaG protein
MRRRRGQDGAAYEARTRDIVVRVSRSMQPRNPRPGQGLYLWSYTVEIENHGGETVTLISRRWTITDGFNRVTDVEGSGVVGEQPELKPREAFRYVSNCPLPTPSGAMKGSYSMVTETASCSTSRSRSSRCTCRAHR